MSPHRFWRLGCYTDSRILLIVSLAVTTWPIPVVAQQDLSRVQIQTTPLTDRVFMLAGAGGNIGLSVGQDGAFLIDDQYAQLSEKIRAAVADQTDQPIRFVLNTHWHSDHTGGNENMTKSGAVIVAHENVRRQMGVKQFLAVFDSHVPPSPPAALPAVTFSDEATFHWNGDTIRVFHVASAHTDGDAIVHFKQANVIHMGDTYFSGMYPFIDTSTGGTLRGMIGAIDRVLGLANNDTKIVPGHGPLSNKVQLQAYRHMLATVRDRVQAMIDQGRSRQETVAAKPTADLDAQWGNGFLKPDQWTGIVFDAIVSPADGSP